ncbi:MAG: hypothetical protein NZM44_02420, partial [Candidatus Calescibacterium sp.]|nr:hypothetical protein [Candidatus Calescibacterium sp.]
MNFRVTQNTNFGNFLLIFGIYFLSNIFFISNTDGIYWDDWCLYNHSLDNIQQMFIEAVGYLGYPISYLHYYLTNVGIFSYRIITFICIFVQGIFLYKIFEKLEFLEKKHIPLLVTIFLISPLYSAKIALINL